MIKPEDMTNRMETVPLEDVGLELGPGKVAILRPDFAVKVLAGHALIQECVDNLHRCLSKIEDEMEVRPGEKTIRGTDAGFIDAAEILKATTAARADLKEIEAALKPGDEK